MIFSVIGQLLVGWLIADFLGGCVHWWEDRVARCDWPLIGPYAIIPNRQHHLDATAFLVGSTLIGRNRAAFPVALLVAAAWWLLLGPSLVLAAAFVGAVISVEVHYQAHLPHEPRAWALRSLLRPLWDSGVIQSPAAHGKHHRLPDGDYCPLTGWLNPFLTHVRFWDGLEWALTHVGLTPNRGTA